jgi:Domain of unknown function (DUF5979)
MKHRARWASVFAVTAALAGFLALSLPAGAGESNSITVEKHVVGTAPAGTTFTVHVVCTQDGAKIPPPVEADVVFDATGTATTPSTVTVPFSSGECTATETVTGGAQTVAYACAAEGFNSDGNGVECEDPEPTSIGALYHNAFQDTATITVTNTFVAPEVVPSPLALTPTFPG